MGSVLNATAKNLVSATSKCVGRTVSNMSSLSQISSGNEFDSTVVISLPGGMVYKETVMLITELVGLVEPSSWGKLVTAFDESDSPTQLLESTLVQDAQNPKLWKVVRRWDSREIPTETEYEKNVEEMVGGPMFQSVGVVPDLAIYKVKINANQNGSKWVSRFDA